MSTMDKYESFQVTFENEKYEIADFINRHPGGTDVLIPYKDKDITKAFNEIGHSAGAKMMLKKRIIKKDKAAEEHEEKVEEETTEKLDAKFVVKKLFTPEDKFNTHKILGFSCLLMYIYRYFYVLPTTGRLGINNDMFSYFTLLLHTALSTSSLIFHVLKRRIEDNPLIIWEEYRLHAILFSVKAVVASLFGLFMDQIPPMIRSPLVIGTLLGSHLIADWITAKFGKPGVTSVRNKDTSSGLIKFGMRSYAFYQLLGQGCFLYIPNGDHDFNDLGYNTLIAIQSSAFLMTLKRKNIIDWPMHAFGYSVCLILSTYYIWLLKGTIYFVYISAVFVARTQLRMNKYLLWGTYIALAHTVLY